MWFQSSAQSIVIKKLQDGTPQDVYYTQKHLIDLSRHLYSYDDPTYIWIDLYKDNILQPSAVYSISIELSGNAGKGDIALPGELESVYIDKWMQFLKKFEEPARLSYELTNQYIADLYRENKSIGIMGHIVRSQLHLTSKKDNEILRELMKDGIVKYNDDLNLYINNSIITVNGATLAPAQDAKYRAMLVPRFGNEFVPTSNASIRTTAHESFFVDGTLVDKP